MIAETLVIGALAAMASAVSTSSVLKFTRVPNPITDDQPQALTYLTNDTSTPVTITLKHGDPNNLQTLQVLTTSASNGQFVWTPCAALPNGNDYALEIRQAEQLNYFGPFVVQGATSGTCPGLSVSSTSTASSSTSSASSSITASNNITITSSSTVSASTGTGTTMFRNVTMSSATLSSTSVSGSTTSSPTGNGAGFQGSATPTPSQSSNDAINIGGSSFALVLGAVVAVLLG